MSEQTQDDSTLNKFIEYKELENNTSLFNLSQKLLSNREAIKQEVKQELSKLKEKDSFESDNEESDQSEDSLDFTDDDTQGDESDEDTSDQKEDDSDEQKEDTSKDDKEPTDKEAKDKPKKSNSLESLFEPLRSHRSDYQTALRKFNIPDKKIAFEEQAVAYVKDDVIKVINDFIKHIDSYTRYITTFLTKRVKSITTIDKRLAYLKEYSKSSVKFTNVLVKDSEIVSKILSRDATTLRASLSVMNTFILKSLNLAKGISTNDLDSIPTLAKNSNFVPKEDKVSVYEYDKQLPGYIAVYLMYTHYKGYLDTEFSDYGVNKVKVYAVTDLANTEPLNLNEEKDLNYLINSLLDCNEKLADMITLASQSVSKSKPIVESCKALSYDIEKNSSMKLSEIPFEVYLKQFVLLKYIYDIVSVTIDTYIDFIGGVFSLLDATVEIQMDNYSEIEPTTENS